MNRTLGLALTAAGSFAVILGLVGGLGAKRGHPSYLLHTSGIGAYSWGIAVVIAILVMAAPAALLTHWLLGRTDWVAIPTLAFGGSVFLPVVIAEDQTHRIGALLVGLAPVVAAALLAKAVGSRETQIGLAAMLLLVHWVGLAIVFPPASRCGFEDCYRSTLWQSALAMGLIWFGSGRLLANPRPI